MLQPGVAIQLVLPEAPELNGVFHIAADNKIKMPLIGLLETEGLVITELEERTNQQLVQFVARPNAELFFAPANYQTYPTPPGLETEFQSGTQLKWMDLQNESNGQCTILADSTIKLPYIGIVSTAGLTLLELEKSVNEQYKQYFRSPNIELFVSNELEDQPSSSVASNSPELAPDQPTYNGFALDYWLKLLARERKHEKVHEALDAVDSLRNQYNSEQIQKALLRAVITDEFADHFKRNRIVQYLSNLDPDEHKLQALLLKDIDNSSLEVQKRAMYCVNMTDNPSESKLQWISDNLLSTSSSPEQKEFGASLLGMYIRNRMVDKTTANSMIKLINHRIEQSDFFWVSFRPSVSLYFGFNDTTPETYSMRPFQFGILRDARGQAIFQRRYSATNQLLASQIWKSAVTVLNTSSDDIKHHFLALDATSLILLDSLQLDQTHFEFNKNTASIRDAFDIENTIQAYAKRVLIDGKQSNATDESKNPQRYPGTLIYENRIINNWRIKLCDFTFKHRLAYKLMRFSRDNQFPLFGKYLDIDDAVNQIGPHFESQQHVKSWDEFIGIPLLIDITEESLATTDNAESSDLICAAILLDEQDPADVTNAVATWVIEKQIARELPELLQSDTATVPIEKIKRFWWATSTTNSSKIDANTNQEITLREIKDFIETQANYSSGASSGTTISKALEKWRNDIGQFHSIAGINMGNFTEARYRYWMNSGIDSDPDEIDLNAVDTNDDDLITRVEYLQYYLKYRDDL